MGEKAANFELEIEDCWHRSRDTARNARRGIGGRGWEERGCGGGLRANAPIDCALKYPTTFLFDVIQGISTIIFHKVREIQTPIRKF